ncbi:MAG TPA: ubiquinone/menaquinone biosynthesis methyltransferase [Thermoplasmata archaeon]|nr:ubiquinone/menaquinone biosynthesis methyltransferase [Thermoplasmata archaeon]
MGEETPAATAPDGSLHPDRRSPTFERDLQRMFATIADRYDLFNHLATFGLDLLWRPRAVWELDRLADRPPRRILDVGCGTGALARQLGHHFRGAAVVGVDFTAAMVRRAQALRGQGQRTPEFAVASLPHLPFGDGTFDLAASAFVARNLADLPAAFLELRRVLRPGGLLLTLEVSEPADPAVRRIFHAHFDHAVPLLGRAFGREGPYSYLPQSLRSFPPRERVVRLLADAGFGRTHLRPMSSGVVTAYLSEATGSAPQP